jgi:superfamily I DNA/RNA helicase
MLRSNFLSEAIDKVIIGNTDDIDLSILSQQIDLWKAKRVTPDQVDDERRRGIYHEYEIIKRSKRFLDFTDLLLIAEKLLSTNPGLLSFYQNRIKCIFLDEMQDANPAWLGVLSHIIPTAELIRVTGDMNQSLYSFRGAVSDFLQPLNELRTFNKATLSTNFRSHDEIISHANEFMQVNMTGVIGAGGSIAYLGHFDNPEQEAEVVTDAITELLEQGTKPSEIMVLCRVGYGLRPISVTLESAGIPFKLVGVKPFFRQPDILDLMAYVKCSLPDVLTRRPWKFHPFMRIYNKPRRGLGKAWESEFWKREGTIWERLQKDYGQYNTGVGHLRDTLVKVKEMDKPMNIIQYIWTFGGYSDYHEKYVDKTTEDVDLFAVHCNHSAVIPHYRGVPDEERRLFFVCSTRAKKKLYFSSCHWGENTSDTGDNSRTEKSKFITI